MSRFSRKLMLFYIGFSLVFMAILLQNTYKSTVNAQSIATREALTNTKNIETEKTIISTQPIETKNAALKKQSAVNNKKENTVTSDKIEGWNKTAIYIKGDRVSYGGQIFEANWWTTNEVPNTKEEWGVWKLVEETTIEEALKESNKTTTNQNKLDTSNKKLQEEGTSLGDIGEKLLIGYWHNFDNGSTNIRLRDIPAEWDVVQVAFGETATDRAIIEFKPYNCTDEEFKQDITYLKKKGIRVLLSLGGQNGVIHIDSPQDVNKFVTSISALVDKYGFNGLDIDVENGITVTEADKNLKSPSTPRLRYTIEAINKVCDKYGDNFWLTMAPEVAYVQGGIIAFGGPWGAYLPIIEGVRNNLTFIHVQHYNYGGNIALDGRNYAAGTADFQVAMAEMLMKGFNVANDANCFFSPLRQDQVAIGIPAKSSAAPTGGYIAPVEMQKALDYLIKGTSFGGQYKLQNSAGYPRFRGVMTWSINWDQMQGNSFAKTYRQYFDSIGGTRLSPIQ